MARCTTTGLWWVACWVASIAAPVDGQARAAAPAGPPAELIFVNGNVTTLDPARPRARALAVAGGRILAVGDDAEVRALARPSTRVVDLAGRAVYPGFSDAHVHVEGLGQALESLDLVGAASLDEALQRVARAASKATSEEWLLGRGWDQNDWPVMRFPTAADLDRVTGGRPALLVRIDGHAAWANSRALALAGLDAKTPDPPGGRLLRDEQGKPTGVLIDAAQQLVARHVPEPSRQVRRRRLMEGLAACARAGLTSVHDAGVDAETIAIYKDLLARAQLDVRVYAMLRGPQAFFDAGEMLVPEHGLGEGYLSVRSIKVVADGALGSRGALLLEPYADEPNSRGLATIDWGRFRDLLRAALARGFQVNTHAIGDAANRRVLDAYAEAFGPGGGAARRFRIEHAQVLSPQDVPRFKALGVIPSMQPTHCTSDMSWAEARLGPQRVRGAYLWRTFVNQGVPVAGGSDAPVERIDVLPGLYAALTRQDSQGRPPGGFYPEERLGFEDALRMFTEHAAFAAFEERERGRLAPGWRADLTLVDRDLAALPPTALLEARIEMTVVGGRVVYDRARPR